MHELAERGRNRKYWLSVGLTEDAVQLRIQRRRNAEAAKEMFAALGLQGQVALAVGCLRERPRITLPSALGKEPVVAR